MMPRTIQVNVKLASDFITSFPHLTHPTSFQLVPKIIWAFEDLTKEQIRTGRGNASFPLIKIKDLFSPMT